MIIVVTGATGNVGRPLVVELVDAGARVRAVTEKIVGRPAETFAHWIAARRVLFTK
jgi:uncharacterized protein YbjT (DUF2867 family)